LGCVHLSYADAGYKLNNFLSNKALFIEEKKGILDEILDWQSGTA
jgi:hypothetical protein